MGEDGTRYVKVEAAESAEEDCKGPRKKGRLATVLKRVAT